MFKFDMATKTENLLGLNIKVEQGQFSANYLIKRKDNQQSNIPSKKFYLNISTEILEFVEQHLSTMISFQVFVDS